MYTVRIVNKNCEKILQESTKFLKDFFCKEFNSLFYFFSVIFASILVITAALIVYLLTRSLRTLAGKYEFMLLLGILFMHCSFIWGETMELLLQSGLLMTSFWTCVLMFEIWRVFRLVAVQELSS